MFLETVRSEGLSHLSYIVGSQGSAAVIDPRRDCEIYIRIARNHGSRISHIFETHRNEDYVIGSRELAHKTSAKIFHGKNMPFHYGSSVSDGDQFKLGEVLLTVLETPGHTYESISIALADKSFNEKTVGIFTGDALFIGDVGRTDFYPEEKEKVAGMLYDSIFGKILPLGDHIILYPGHGAGSVCGAGMASREFSTTGFERLTNPILKLPDKGEFIKHKVNERHYKPPYFRQMEKYNKEGPPLLHNLPSPVPVGAEQFKKSMNNGMIALDIRSPEAIAGAYIPGSTTIPLDMVPAFAGWFLPYDQSLGLIAEKHGQVQTAVRYLIRLGYDSIAWYLEGGLHEWEISGGRFDSIQTIHAEELMKRLESNTDFTLLDVRGTNEFKEGHLPHAKNLYVGELPQKLEELNKDQTITTFCGSGKRAMIAATILRNKGFKNVENCLGSMAACRAVGWPTTAGD